MFLIAGLGNIGSIYQKTRHNFGFLAVDKIIENYQFDCLFSSSDNKNKIVSNKFKSDIFIGNIADSRIMIIKPQTYMNLSGESIIAVMNFYKINIENILIIHDEIDINFGKIKTKIGGGNAGHNGLRSIDNLIGKNYARIRLGVGRPDNINMPNLSIADYVLSNFYDNEKIILDKMINHLVEKADKAFNNADKIDINLLKNFDL